jgi:hypothetical protein
VEVVLAESDDFLGAFLQGPESINLGLQVLLALAGRFQFLLDDLSVTVVRVGAFELGFQDHNVAVADAMFERPGQAAFKDLGEAAQLAFDQFRLSHKDGQNAVLLAVGVDEIVPEDLLAGLELAVDTAVALLHPARVPGHAEVEEVPAVSLEVEALAGCVGGDQDTERILLRVRREGSLDFLALGRRGRPVIDGDSLASPVRCGNGGRELLL